jgi:Type VI secretion system/phage-baseplate injector OB domain
MDQPLLPLTYAGLVEAVNDPTRRGRIKVRVPHAYGPDGVGGLSTADLPWAWPAGLPQGGTADSGMITWIPKVGDQVLVRFLDGDPEMPLYEWFCQSRGQRDAYDYHAYEPDGQPTNRAALGRHGHSIELNPAGLIFTTARGYYVVLNDGTGLGDGSIIMGTPKGHSVTLDDAGDVLTTYVTNWVGFTDDVIWTTREWQLDALEITRVRTPRWIAESATELSWTSPKIYLGNGSDDILGLIIALIEALAPNTIPAPNGQAGPFNAGTSWSQVIQVQERVRLLKEGGF